MMAKKKQVKKKKFTNMEITRVKMNPEQAVLTCCDSSARAQVGTYQCYIPIAFRCDPGGSISGALAS